MIYAVLFEDNNDRAEMRTRHMNDHLAFLERHSDRISAAGPLRDMQADAAAGGLWLVEAGNSQAIRELVEADPFWSTGLRKSVRILQWTQVFADGKREV